MMKIRTAEVSSNTSMKLKTTKRESPQQNGSESGRFCFNSRGSHLLPIISTLHMNSPLLFFPCYSSFSPSSCFQCNNLSKHTLYGSTKTAHLNLILSQSRHRLTYGWNICESWSSDSSLAKPSDAGVELLAMEVIFSSVVPFRWLLLCTTVNRSR